MINKINRSYYLIIHVYATSYVIIIIMIFVWFKISFNIPNLKIINSKTTYFYFNFKINILCLQNSISVLCKKDGRGDSALFFIL